MEALSEIRLALAAASPDCRVVCADAGKQALEVAQSNPPQAVLADMRLSDMSGLKLLLKVKGQNPNVITMMMSDCGSPSARKMCLDAGVDFFFEKPIDVHKLLGMLGADEPDMGSVFRGTLDNLSVPDVVQLVICRPSAMLMRIDSPHGTGSIEIESGNVIHAQANGVVGEEAFYDLMNWEEGHFEVVDVVGVEQRTIALPLPALLMNAVGREPDNDTLQDATSMIEERHESFFPPESTAPEVSHVWAPMAEYARPQLQPSRRQPVALDTNRARMPRLKAFRYTEESEVQLRLRPREERQSTYGQARNPATAPARRRPGRHPRRSLVPATRRIAVASLCAVALLFCGVRYTGLFGGSYGRDMGPLLNNLFGDFTPAEVETIDNRALSASGGYAGAPQHSGNGPVKARRIPQGGEPGGSVDTGVRLVPNAFPTAPVEISLSRNEILTSSANSIGVSPAMAAKLNIQANPWVEAVGANGKRIGVFAIEMRDAVTPVLLPKTLYYALAESGSKLTHVKLRPITWTRETSAESLAFGRTRNLTGQYCEYWYSVGLSLKAMQTAGLAPGAYAVVRGPSGHQSVRVQLVDRGHPGEIWLSQPVLESIGAAEGQDIEVKLFPKT